VTYDYGSGRKYCEELIFLVPVHRYDTCCKPNFSAKLAFETALKIAIEGISVHAGSPHWTIFDPGSFVRRKRQGLD